MNAYGTPDYGVYPHMQVWVNGTLAGEWDVSGSAQNYSTTVTVPGTVMRYFHNDHLSLRAATDVNGTVVATSAHYPFGESWYETGGNNKLKFTSYERDSESGNDCAIMRYDVARLGRFSSVDPLGGSAGNPQSLNRYAYVGSDPANLVDPTGLESEQICWDGFLRQPGNNLCERSRRGPWFNFGRFGKSNAFSRVHGCATSWHARPGLRQRACLHSNILPWGVREHLLHVLSGIVSF